MIYFDENKISHEMYLHLLWSTKEQQPIITSPISKSLYHYIADLMLACDATLIAGKIFTDHIQLIIKFNPDTVVQDLFINSKVATSLWVRSNYPELKDFEWQKSDFSFSVSYDEVINLIDRIERTKSFSEEVSSILCQCGIQFDPVDILE
jgi:putative transposase